MIKSIYIFMYFFAIPNLLLPNTGEQKRAEVLENIKRGYIVYDDPSFHYPIRGKRFPYKLANLSDEYKDDEKIAFAAIKTDFRSFFEISDRLKNDRDFIFDVISFNGRYIEYVKEIFQDDDEIVWTALEQKSYYIEHASERIKSNYQVVEKLLAQSETGYAFQFVGINIRSDRDFIMNQLKLGHNILRDAVDEIRSDRAFAIEAIKVLPRSFNGVSDKLKDDKELCLFAISIDPVNIWFTSKRLRQDPDVLDLLPTQ